MSDNLPFVVEKPDGTVKREATSYCSFGSVLDGYLRYDEIGDMTYFPPPKVPEWRIRTSPYYDEIELPEPLRSNFRYFYFNIDEALAETFTNPLRIRRHDVSPYVPDIDGWPPFSIVSERAR